MVKTDTKAPVKADPAVREATRLERAKEAKERGNQLTRQGATVQRSGRNGWPRSDKMCQ